MGDWVDIPPTSNAPPVGCPLRAWLVRVGSRYAPINNPNLEHVDEDGLIYATGLDLQNTSLGGSPT